MNHKHEWRILHIQWPCSTSVFCNCGEKLELDEIERRLNATECLGTGRAGEIAEIIKIERKGIKNFSALKEYIRTLERR